MIAAKTAKFQRLLYYFGRIIVMLMTDPTTERALGCSLAVKEIKFMVGV
jgi:hypothetical protein